MDLARQSLAITFVLALLWAALWFLKRKGAIRIRGNSGQPSLLETRGKLVLTAQHSIHVVRVGPRNLVLAIHPGGISLLCDAEDAGEKFEIRPPS